MANKLNITKGDYIPREADKDNWACISLESNTVLTCYATHMMHLEITEKDNEASNIVLLAADALNTYQAANILPSDLLQQRNEAVRILKRVIHSNENINDLYNEINELIQKLTQ